MYHINKTDVTYLVLVYFPTEYLTSPSQIRSPRSDKIFKNAGGGAWRSAEKISNSVCGDNPIDYDDDSIIESMSLSLKTVVFFNLMIETRDICRSHPGYWVLGIAYSRISYLVYLPIKGFVYISNIVIY